MTQLPNDAQGTPVICHMYGSHFHFGYVKEVTTDRFGKTITIAVTVRSDEGKVDETNSAAKICDADMKGIGWKVATIDEVRLANLYSM